jgi:dystrophin
MNESRAFGGLSVGGAVENCFQMSGNSVGISEESFTEWMLQEPQTIVWLPMMHRLSASESVKHDAKCSVCKISPITGFR